MIYNAIPKTESKEMESLNWHEKVPKMNRKTDMSEWKHIAEQK